LTSASRVRALDFVNAVVGTITARDSSTIAVRTAVTPGAGSEQHADVVIRQNRITMLEVSRGQRSVRA